MEKSIKTIEELGGRIFFTSTACMSVWADALSWANKYQERIAKEPAEADHIVILSCQVTDLAVLNDFRTLDKYRRQYPDKKYFISGCLAKRMDIPVPAGAERLELPRADYQPIEDRTLIRFEPPFWVHDFDSEDKEFEQGHLFRNMYPLRIGKGCPFNCTYCTIRFTRGKFAKYDVYARLEKEFLEHEDVLLIADSPMPDQIKEWCRLAIKHNKHISIRNIEPKIAVLCRDDLLNLARKKLLKVFHAPIQSDNEAVLKDMARDVEATFATMDLCRRLKVLGVFIATNIIIDYKDFPNDFTEVYKLYDYVSWNPLWDRQWDRKKAEERYAYYLENGNEVNNAKFFNKFTEVTVHGQKETAPSYQTVPEEPGVEKS